MIRVALVIGCVCWLVACSSTVNPSTASSADIAKVASVKSSFGPEFHVMDVPPTGINPKLLAAQKLPEGLKFQPADCAKLATGQALPPGVQGNMSAVAAEGNGNRFIVMAVETSQPLPFSDPGPACQKVGFSGDQLRGVIEVVGVPQIAGTRTLGVHRVVQTVVAGKTDTGEIYNYSAHFGDYQVFVTANPLVIPGKPVTPVDTRRAQDLLSAAVAAVRR